MTNKQFCKIYSSYYGETIDNIGQLTFKSFDGEELKDFLEHTIRMNETFKTKEK